MLFEQPGWEEEEGAGGAPQLSALTWAAVQAEGGKKRRKKSKESKVTSKSSLKGSDKFPSDESKKEKKRKKSKDSKPSSESKSDISISDSIPSNEPKKKKKLKKPKITESGEAADSLAKKAGKLTAKLGHSLAVTAAYKLDKFANSPSATKALLDNDSSVVETKQAGQVVDKLVATAKKVGKAGKQLGRSLSGSSVVEEEGVTGGEGNLLGLGERFSSHEAFLRFIGLPGKGKRGNKRSRSEVEENTEEHDGTENDAFNGECDMKEGSASPPPIPPPRKKRKEGGLDISKLREVLAKEPAPKVPQPIMQSDRKLKKTIAEEAKLKLSASRFRYLNEQLYCQPGNASAKLFKSDPTLFTSYHQGYQHQAAQWPLDPLNTIIADCLRLDDKAVIADFGCGEARLARSVENKVHSFDLVAANETVTACDMANVPLEDNTVDVTVFCLALMGTNTRDFLFEATRVLKVGGTLKIAELESRFQGEACSIDKFIESVEKFGFKNSCNDLKKDFFYFLDFKKVQGGKKKKGKLPEIELKPCLYKKR
eukprot:TRINITY_DN74388_c0_g1_i1.p1 TRINITY_DN74388_c0_g1~~TRINITY_DN74388_c0_g1_i1.p1  ORF type:complete len:539 (-),score=231.21 TRINITY_DN74388_c0_g1_i1:48-1664(-)